MFFLLYGLVVKVGSLPKKNLNEKENGGQKDCLHDLETTFFHYL